MKKILAFALCLTMVFGMFSFAHAEETVYRALYGSEVSTLNYLITGNSWDQEVGANVIDTLIEYDAFGNVIPGLAESWETSDDELTWTFHLRQGQKWYDYQGKAVAEVTAQDFVDAAKYVLTAEYDASNEYMFEEANVVNAAEYYNGDVTDFAEVGVKALDAYTLQYTLTQPTPYLLSCLTYVNFMPAYGPQLEELGLDFGTSCDKMYYCGAYIMTEFEPQQHHTYVKNTNNWDAANVFIDRIERMYNSEYATIAPTMALRGEVDFAELSNDIVDDWKASYPEMLTRSRIVPQYSYFYCFNFDPKYDEEYAPADWTIAVNNSNFRHSLMSGFDRMYSMIALEPDAPETVVQNAITPSGFCTVDGVDYTAMDNFATVGDYYFNPDKALAYKEAAVAELTEAGVTFPIKVVVTYKSGDSDWENETLLLESQMENLLGADYIDIIPYAGPSESFLSSTRRAGVYSMMRCNWGADYSDPLTFASAFGAKFKEGAYVGNSYNKMDVTMNDENSETGKLVAAYYEKVAEAKAIVNDTKARYGTFADAEMMLISNAIIVPYFVSPSTYQVTKLNIFEGEYSPCGVSTLRFKYQHLSEDFITAEAYEANFSAWKEAMGM